MGVPAPYPPSRYPPKGPYEFRVWGSGFRVQVFGNMIAIVVNNRTDF